MVNFIIETKKTTVYHLLASITDVMSFFRKQQRFFPLFLLAAAKSVLRILTVKYHVLLTCLAQCLEN